MRTARSVLVVVVALALIAGAAPGARAGQRAPRNAADMADLSLEDLLELQLGAMRISSIHHTHDAGEFMVGYQYMFMRMDGNRDGTSGVSTSEVLAQVFMVSPTDMNMQMHMLHLMYAPVDELTLMLMVPYTKLSMDHVAMMGGVEFETNSEGLGDIKLTGLYSVYKSELARIVFNAGVSFPTGSIDEKDQISMVKVQLPYPMQLGSGTFDLIPGLTYLGQIENWAWGAHAEGTIRLGENDNDYRLGNRYSGTLWGSRKLLDWLSASLRVEGQSWLNIHGSDPALNPSVVPTADPNRRAGRRLDLLFGLNLFRLEGKLAGNRIAVEAGLPVYQWLDGPQLETDWRLSAAWDWTF